MGFEFKFNLSDSSSRACLFTIAAVVLTYGAIKIRGVVG